MNKRGSNLTRLTITLLLILTFLGTALPAGAVDWSSDIRLTYDEYWDQRPSIIQTLNGSIWVVWQSDRIAFQEDLYYSTSPNYGSSWSPDTRLTDHSGYDVMPSIIQTWNGSIWVVWSSYRGGNYDLFYKTSPNYGLSWSPDIQLTTYAGRDVHPSITQTANGSIWVVWSRDVEDNYDLFYKTSPNYGSSWSPETQLTTDLSWDFYPSIIQTWNGSIWVVWSSYRTADYELFYKTSPDYGSSWSPETQLTTDPDFDECPSVIQARDGSIWVVWHSDRGGGVTYALYYKTSPDYGSNWSLDTELVGTSYEDMSPSITNTDEGTIWVAWATDKTGEPDKNFEIFYKISDEIVVHDVAVTEVTPSATNATPGETVTIDVVAENQGTQDETFEVDCYADSTLIGTETTTLTAGTSTTLTYLWDTSDFHGTYLISANATIVPGENLPHTADNRFTDGTVLVGKAVKGDVDGDGDVDLDDLYYVLAAYGARVGDPDYNPDADIDKDGVVELNDLYYVLRNYGDC